MLPISFVDSLVLASSTGNHIVSLGLAATTVAIGVGAALLAKGAFDWLSGRDKADAQKEAARRAEQLIREGKDQASAILLSTHEVATKYYNDNMDKAEAALKSGNTAAANAYKENAAKAEQSINTGFDKGRTDLSSGYSKARTALEPMAGLAHYGEDALTGKGFETSGGYQFRLGQGQQALDRSQAAAGGRYSGAALKAGMNYNQGMASNEYGAWADRASNLGRVGYGAQTGISDLYGREGQGLSGLSVSQGGALSQLHSNTGSYLSGLEERGGQGLSRLSETRGTNLANMETGYGTSMANVDTGQASQMASLQPGYAAGAGNTYAALGSTAGDFGQLMMYGYGAGAGSGNAAPSNNDVLSNGMNYDPNQSNYYRY